MGQTRKDGRPPLPLVCSLPGRADMPPARYSRHCDSHPAPAPGGTALLPPQIRHDSNPHEGHAQHTTSCVRPRGKLFTASQHLAPERTSQAHPRGAAPRGRGLGPVPGPAWGARPGPRAGSSEQSRTPPSRLAGNLASGPIRVGMSERLDQQVARAWRLLEIYENDRADSIAANAVYDRAGVLVPDPGGPESAPAQLAHLPVEGAGTRAGLPPARVLSYEEVVNRGPPSPGSWVYLAETCRSSGTVPMMRFVYWDQESDTWRRFAACPDCFEPYTVQQPWASLASAEPGRNSRPRNNARAEGGGGTAPNLRCLRAVGRRH